MWKKIRGSRGLQIVLGRLLAGYLRLVWNTSRLTVEPADLYEWIDGELPIIVAFWHGQHFLAPFILKPHHRGAVMISRHVDAEYNAVAAEALGIGTIRGSGGSARDFHRKGGAAAAREMVETLAHGTSVAMTADVPKVARVAGLGVVSLARHSSRPIVPIALASSNRIELSSWDRAHVNLPFSRIALVAAELVRVKPEAGAAAMEAARRLVQDRLAAATARAEALVGRPAKGTLNGA
jgi:lysophospholipid acyltransferase (LPLAT)-like uncharacterized protein